VPQHSVYPYSPVFPCRIGGRRAVIKRTRRAPADAEAVAAVTRQWAAQGVAVVTPLDLAVANPVRLGDAHWVAYPFVAGRLYTGRLTEAAAAGALLGRMHAASVDATVLPAYRWPDYDQATVAEDVATLRTVMTPHAPDRVVKRLVDLVACFMVETMPRLRDARLPHVNASMDYKANNLVYAGAGPVLVDPDNGDFAPRLLDLAQAVLLFHTEHDPAPPRLFDAAQWSAFIQAYLQHVRLTDHERALWPVAVDYMLSDEGHWAFTGEPDEWHAPRQRSFLLSLAEARAEDYPIP
jgi:Ser/Thr protein kinase RdoA (MazF antagonist)